MLAKPHPSEVFARSNVGGAHEVYGPVLPLEEPMPGAMLEEQESLEQSGCSATSKMIKA